jgi:hypothetical protein
MRAQIISLIALVAGCSGPTDDPGADFLLHVANSQLYRGAMPTAMDGPAVGGLSDVTSLLRPGQRNKSVSGTVDPKSQAVAIGLSGDPGYFILLPGAPDITANNQLTFSASLSFADRLAPGKYQLVARAVDGDGHFGPPATLDLTAADNGIPSGQLVISLIWHAPVDLDLHVVDPAGVEIWARNVNSWRPTPGQPTQPDDWKKGGLLDGDSNAGCQIDGRDLEDVVWQMTPPSGHYIVRVDTPSLCGQADAFWTVEVRSMGSVIASARGVALDADTRGPHDQGAGLTALEFDLP